MSFSVLALMTSDMVAVPHSRPSDVPCITDPAAHGPCIHIGEITKISTPTATRVMPSKRVGSFQGSNHSPRAPLMVVAVCNVPRLTMNAKSM